VASLKPGGGKRFYSLSLLSSLFSISLFLTHTFSPSLSLLSFLSLSASPPFPSPFILTPLFLMFSSSYPLLLLPSLFLHLFPILLLLLLLLPLIHFLSSCSLSFLPSLSTSPFLSTSPSLSTSPTPCLPPPSVSLLYSPQKLSLNHPACT